MSANDRVGGDDTPDHHEAREHAPSVAFNMVGRLEADDGANVPPASSQNNAPVVSFTAQQEAQVVRKLDRHLMTLLFVLCMITFLDRGNIANAHIAGMDEDLGFDNEEQYQWLFNIFYIAYVIFEPTALLWKIVKPHHLSATIVFCWASFAIFQSCAHSWADLMALRFFLGILEACFVPGAIYLLSFFYLRHEIGFRCGIFASAAPLASTFAGALAYGITNGYTRVRGWRLLFVVEGLPAMAMSIAALYYLPDSAEDAVGTVGSARIGAFNPRDILPAILDLKVWICAFMYFCGNVSYSSLPIFLPALLQDMGFTSINAQGLSAPPSFAAFVSALVTTWIADRTKQRCLIIFAAAIVGATGYIVLATVESVAVRYFATFLASAGVFSTIPNILGLTLNNQGSDTRRGLSIVIINLVGQCGPFLGTNIFPAREGPRYINGMSLCAIAMLGLALLVMIQRSFLIWENGRLDHQSGPAGAGAGAPRDGEQGDGNGEQGVELDDIAVENYGSRFRNVF
ncbi:MFS general substrate transporter [Durotheca rogersii]|uniref:MFS general substrate transporter n=1 Tax=Durotheca rogersii TaxID=419775 RepID=UPI002220A92C|nr:MFS general substrate transporter [Durotheca rogersii]KAI5868143.1 MFS general substrate transporter [Durotheca rogersii]